MSGLLWMECQKPLTFLHKEKNNLSVSKGCYEERCWSSNKNLSNFCSVSKTKTDPKSDGSHVVVLKHSGKEIQLD